MAPMDTITAARALAGSQGVRQVEHVSRDAGVTFARDPAVSGTGRYVAWLGALPGAVAGTFDVFLTDRVGGTTEHLTRGADRGSNSPALSADGRRVAFQSHASNLVPDDTNGVGDVFVYDRDTRALTRVSDGGAEPALSGDGRFVAYTAGDDLVLRDLESGSTETLARGARAASLSADGRFVAFEQEGRGLRLDRQTGSLVEIPAEGRCWSPTLSADGRLVAWLSAPEASPWAETRPPARLFVRDLETGQTRSVDRDHEGRPLETAGEFALSADGRTIAFQADPVNRRLVLQTDLPTGETRVVNARPDGAIDYGESLGPALSADGRTLVLATSCRNLGEQQVRVDSGFEPYRIFALDSGNVRLGLERAVVEPPGAIQVGEATVEVGGVTLPRR